MCATTALLMQALVEDSSKLFSEVLVVSGVNLLTQQFEDDRSGYNCEGMVSHRGRGLVMHGVVH